MAVETPQADCMASVDLQDVLAGALAAKWTQPEAIALCRQIEAICPQFGCHVALTGGLLYKDGPRKDCDLLFYRIRQVPEIDMDGLFDALATIGVVKCSGFGWCHKARYQGRQIDCFFPEEDSGEYEQAEPDDMRGWTEESIAEAVADMKADIRFHKERLS